MQENPNLPQAGGYNGPDARRRFWLSGIIAVLVALALQIVLPELLLRPSAAQDVPFRLELIHPDGICAWSDSLWYVATMALNDNGAAESGGGSSLIRLTANERKTIANLGSGKTFLLPYGNSLLIFSPDGLARYDGETTEYLSASMPGAERTPPFLFHSQPALLAKSPENEFAVYVFENGAWREETRFSVKDAGQFSLDDLRVVANDIPHLFLQKDGKLLYRAGWPAEEEWNWQVAAQVDDSPWTAVISEGSPAAIIARRKAHHVSAELVLARTDAGAWKETVLKELPYFANAVGATAENNPTIIYQSVPWSLNVLRLAGGKIIAEDRYGEFPSLQDPQLVSGLETFAALLLVTLVLAFVLAALNRRYRTRIFTEAGPPVPLASLPARIAAFAMDFLIVAGPAIATSVYMLHLLSVMETRPVESKISVAVLLLVGAMLWGIVGTFLFIYLTGKRGRTPGKWVMRLRVVSLDLRPCGFGRAFMRAVLIVPDSLLSFMVAVTWIGFTRNRQRLGDLLARTIVVRDIGHPVDTNQSS